MMKKTLRKLSMVLTVVMVMSVFAVQHLAAEVQVINSQSDLVPEIDSKQELRRWRNPGLVPEIDSKQELRRWWNPGFDGYSVEKIKAAIGFEDTTDEIEPRPSSIIWEENDTFAVDIVWSGPLNKIHTQEHTNTYRFNGRSPLAFCFLSLNWRAYDLATGKPADVPPENFEVWYRSSLDGISFSDWHRVRGDGKSDEYYVAPFFGLSLPHGEVHRYFEILVHVPPSTRLDSVDLSVSDNTTNTLIKHGLMTDEGIKQALETGMISIEGLDPSALSNLAQRGFIEENMPYTDEKDKTGSVNVDALASNTSTSPPRPAIFRRSEWWGDLPSERHWVYSRGWLPNPTGAITHAIIHHTTCINNPTDPMVNMRQIWRFHAQTRGWGDIGYNFLIDHLGRIYHGRFNLNLDASPPQDVWGAHTVGFNTRSMGIAFIGTFTTVNPTNAAISSANRLIAWRFHQRNINPLGVGMIGDAGGTGLRTPRNITRIFGHMDVAATNCPGYFFYDRLPRHIRLNVASLMGRMRSPILYAPMGGESWRRAGYPPYQSGIVWWHFPGVPATSNVRIDLSENSGSTWQTIVASTPNDGNHRWPVPGGARTLTARIRVVSLQNTAVQSASVANFYLW